MENKTNRIKATYSESNNRKPHTNNTESAHCQSIHWLFLNSQNSQIANSKNTIFEAIWKIDYVVTMSDKHPC